ncbi:hypothetical protein MTQ16_04060 [Corynebacterium bovis]
MVAPDEPHERRGDDAADVDEDAVEREAGDPLRTLRRLRDQRRRRADERLRHEDAHRRQGDHPPGQRMVDERERGEQDDVDQRAADEHGDLPDVVGQLPAGDRPRDAGDTHDDERDDDRARVHARDGEEDRGEQAEEAGRPVDERGDGQRPDVASDSTGCGHDVGLLCVVRHFRRAQRYRAVTVRRNSRGAGAGTARRVARRRRWLTRGGGVGNPVGRLPP